MPDTGPMTAPQWRRPADLGTALGLLQQGATAVGGATTLLSHAFAPTIGDVACDLADLLPAGLSGHVLGAATTLDAIATHPTVAERWPAVAAAAAGTATPQVRRLATLGGTVAARLPTADLPAALAAHGAVVRFVSTPPPASTSGHGDPVVVGELDVSAYLADPPTGRHLVIGVVLTRTGDGAYRRFALRRGPAPAIATVAGVRHDDGTIRFHAGAVGPGPAPVAFTLDAPPPAAALRTDPRGSAEHRARLVAALAREIADELDGPRPPEPPGTGA